MKSDIMLKCVIENKINCLVFSKENYKEVFERYNINKDDFIVIDNSYDNIEDYIENKKDNRTIIYFSSEEDSLWNKIFVMLLNNPNKHIIVWNYYKEDTKRVDMKINNKEILNTIILF